MDTTTNTRPEREFPEPGTTNHRVLAYIKANPGVTTNAILRALSLNPGPTRACLQKLINRGLIEDRPDERDYHHHYAIEQTADETAA